MRNGGALWLNRHKAPPVWKGRPHWQRDVSTSPPLPPLRRFAAPCAQDGPTWRPEAIAKGGKRQFPYMVDPNNADLAMYESDAIIQYLCDTYGNGKVGGCTPCTVHVHVCVCVLYASSRSACLPTVTCFAGAAWCALVPVPAGPAEPAAGPSHDHYLRPGHAAPRPQGQRLPGRQPQQAAGTATGVLGLRNLAVLQAGPGEAVRAGASTHPGLCVWGGRMPGCRRLWCVRPPLPPPNHWHPWLTGGPACLPAYLPACSAPVRGGAPTGRSCLSGAASSRLHTWRTQTLAWPCLRAQVFGGGWGAVWRNCG